MKCQELEAISRRIAITSYKPILASYILLIFIGFRHGSICNSHRSALAQLEIDQALDAACRYSWKSRAASTWRPTETTGVSFEAWCSETL